MRSDKQLVERHRQVGPRFVRWLVQLAIVAGLAAVIPPLIFAQDQSPIKEVLLVHFAHTDFGYTDQPEVVRELHRHYVDVALDAAWATRVRPPGDRFCWTIESQYTFGDWWKSTTPARRSEFVEMFRAGQLDVSALAVDATPYMDRQEWRLMTHWIPDEVWKRVGIQSGMQDDVNGLPRAGAMALLDHGIARLWTGINVDLGGAPQKTPSAFWWKMPDGRRLFVWLGVPYSEGYHFFAPHNWRHGPLPAASDTLYRPPAPEEIFKTDPASLQSEHERLMQQLQQYVAAGYKYPVFVLPFTNQWRIDNDPPYPSIVNFVAVWNRAGLSPRIRLVTITEALQQMEKIAGPDSPEFTGEFPDWWADGTMSAPRAVSASRLAKRSLAEASSPVFGSPSAAFLSEVDGVNRDLVLFDEHTFGSASSVAFPDSLDTLGQFAEKSLLAYAPMAQARWLLGKRARTAFDSKGEGFFTINATSQPWSGWAKFNASALREDDVAAIDPSTSSCFPLQFSNGLKSFTVPTNPGEITPENSSQVFADNLPGQEVSVWIDSLPGNSSRHLLLSPKPCPAAPVTSVSAPKIEVDEKGWPTSIAWPGMPTSLIASGFGDLVAVNVDGFAPRAKIHEISDMTDPAKRRSARKQFIKEIHASESGAAIRTDNPRTVVFTQTLSEPSLAWITRRLEIWRDEPRARIEIQFSRLSSDLPEAIFASFPLPVGEAAPKTSNAGVPFLPYIDQIPGSCRDYFATDGWVHYASPQGHWLWASRDAPLITFGETNVLARRTDAPARTNRVLAMLFNNFWYTNFVANSTGEMDYRFDLVWRKDFPLALSESDLAESLSSDPVLLINPDRQTDKLYLKWLFQP
ncbi:MAG: hypothetical protein WBF35_07140 [Candidatus Acidiferrales bacterium]